MPTRFNNVVLTYLSRADVSKFEMFERDSCRKGRAMEIIKLTEKITSAMITGDYEAFV